MGVDCYIVNHETRRLFTVRNFKGSEMDFLKAVHEDREAVRRVVKDYQCRASPDYVAWLTDTLWEFTRGSDPGRITVTHDDEWSWDSPVVGPYFTLSKNGYTEAGTMWDYQPPVTPAAPGAGSS